jgi:hypothetical protein
LPALGKSLSEPLNGEVVSGDWRFYADQITTAWRKSVASIIETGAVGARGEKLRRNARVSGLTRLVAFAEDANALRFAFQRSCLWRTDIPTTAHIAEATDRSRQDVFGQPEHH